MTKFAVVFVVVAAMCCIGAVPAPDPGYYDFLDPMSMMRSIQKQHESIESSINRQIEEQRNEAREAQKSLNRQIQAAKGKAKEVKHISLESSSEDSDDGGTFVSRSFYSGPNGGRLIETRNGKSTVYKF